MSYNPPPLQQNAVPVIDPSLNDAMSLMQKKINLDLTCHHIGTIQSFDPDTQTASVTINYTKTYFNYDPVTNSNVPFQVQYPMILDCPVICLGGGPASLTFPIASGDQCLLLFNDRDIDNWFQGNPPMPVATPRLHSFSDAIALVGLRPITQSIPGYDTSNTVLQFGTTKVSVGESLVTIANNMTTLNTLLQDLISTISSLTTTNCVVGDPVVLDPAVIADLTSIGTQIAGLLG